MSNCNACEDTGIIIEEIEMPLEPCCRQWEPDGSCCEASEYREIEVPCPKCSNNEE